MSHDGGGGHGGDHGYGHDLHGHTQGHHGPTDGHGGIATIEALLVSYSHGGGSHGPMNFGAHVNGAHTHDMHVVHLGLGRQDRRFGGPEDTETNEKPGEVRVFVVHVTNHGENDVLTKLKQVARRQDMIRIDQFRPNFDAVDTLKYEIADWTAFTEPYQHKNMPEGFYPGANGNTRIVRWYYQVGKRPRWWAAGSDPEFDKDAGTFIEVTCVQWRYQEAADFETKIILSVGSVAVWDEVVQKWGFRKTPFIKHQRAAIKVCEAMFDYLVAQKPSKAATILRAAVRKKYPETADTHPDGVASGSPEDKADLSRGRHPDPEAPPPPGGTPAPPADDPIDSPAPPLFTPASVVASDVELADDAAPAQTTTVVVDLDD